MGFLSDIRQFSKLCLLRKNIWKDNKHNSLPLARNYARIFVLGHYLLTVFLEPRSCTKSCSLLGTNNVRGQISEYIFATNGGYCVHNDKLTPSCCTHLTCHLVKVMRTKKIDFGLFPNSELRRFTFIFQGVRVLEVITIRLITPMEHLRTRYGNEAM